jgi:hypothetical protein
MDIVALAKEVGGQATISILLIVASWQAIRMILRRGEKDAEVLRRTLEREQVRVDREQARVDRERERLDEHLDEWQDDITENTKEKLILFAQLEQCRLDLANSKEMLARSGIGGLSASEEKALREMIVRLKAENYRLTEELKSKDESQ